MCITDCATCASAESVVFFPSSYRRAVKYGQRDAANEILRTETLAKISEVRNMKSEDSKTRKKNKDNDEQASSSLSTLDSSPLYIVTYPAALAELVVSKQQFDERKIELCVAQRLDIVVLERQLADLGFVRVDYVYEPGQFAVRGSIVDVYSFSSELPYRIDFFGDEIDSIRTFELETQLSLDRKQQITILPALATVKEQKEPFTTFLPENTLVVTKDLLFVRDNH